MDDMMKCPKCGGQTNKYYPYCEHCSGPIPHEAPNSPGASAAAGTRSGDTGTIEDRGAAVFAELGKHSNRTRKCPFCAEEILADAIKCRFCGEFIKKASSGEKTCRIALLSFLACAALLFVVVLTYFGIKDSPVGATGVRYTNALSVELKGNPAKANYVKKYITLSDTGTLEETDTRGVATKFLCGTIKNSGDKTVIKLTLGVYYFDKHGRCIGEGSVSPILGTKAKPASIKPAGSHEFKLPILTVNPDWSGKIKEKVTDIELL